MAEAGMRRIESGTLHERITAAVKNNRGNLPWHLKNPVTDYFSFKERHIISMYEIQDAILETLPKLERGSNEYKSLIGEMAARPGATLEAIEITLGGWNKSKQMEKNVEKASIILDVLERTDDGKTVDILQMIVDNGPAELLQRAQKMHHDKREAWIRWVQILAEQNASPL